MLGPVGSSQCAQMVVARGAYRHIAMGTAAHARWLATITIIAPARHRRGRRDLGQKWTCRKEVFRLAVQKANADLPHRRTRAGFSVAKICREGLAQSNARESI